MSSHADEGPVTPVADYYRLTFSDITSVSKHVKQHNIIIFQAVNNLFSYQDNYVLY